MMRKTLIAVIWMLILAGCRDDCVLVEQFAVGEPYAIILVAGQSNTHAGIGLDPALDGAVSSVLQLGRFCGYDREIIPAVEPLDHHTRTDGRIGFALTFAKLYAAELLGPDRRVLIIPAGYGGTGFSGHHWNKGDELYRDAVDRVRYVLAGSPESELVAILWHQGESDVGHAAYRDDLDRFITDIRTDLERPAVPFVLGGMVPYWVAGDPARAAQQAVIAQTPTRMTGTAYADPQVPFTIVKPDDTFDAIHYDAAGMREMGRRYYAAYKTIR